jgi:hypothetical protein
VHHYKSKMFTFKILDGKGSAHRGPNVTIGDLGCKGFGPQCEAPESTHLGHHAVVEDCC